jgi:hypothetical protein
MTYLADPERDLESQRLAVLTVPDLESLLAELEINEVNQRGTYAIDARAPQCCRGLWISFPNSATGKNGA